MGGLNGRWFAISGGFRSLWPWLVLLVAGMGWGFSFSLAKIAAIGQPVHGIALALQAGGQFVGQGHVVFDKQQAHVSRLPRL